MTMTPFEYMWLGFLVSYVLLWACIGFQMYTISKLNEINRLQNQSIRLMQEEIERLAEQNVSIIEGCTTIDEFCKSVHAIFTDPKQWDDAMNYLQEVRLAQAVQATSGRPN